jgi:hypothetical protein
MEEKRRLALVRQLRLFDHHVFELTRLEDLATFEALHEFGVLLASDDLHPRMLAL